MILENIKKHLPSWAEAVNDINDQLEIKKLSGMSNSCYKVKLDKRVKLSDLSAPRAVLYRKLENEVVDKEIEYTIFKSMSDSGQGPEMIGSAEGYRIEGFIESRVLSIWEMRNPLFMDMFVQAIFEMHHWSGTAEAIQKIEPLDVNHLGVDISIDQWGPASIERLSKMRQKLSAEKVGDAKILSALNSLE